MAPRTPARRISQGCWGLAPLDPATIRQLHADHSPAEGRIFSCYDTEEHGTIRVITDAPG